MTRLLLATALLVALSHTASAQPRCQLVEASRAYTVGAFDQTVQLISACLAGYSTEGERAQAYALRAKVALATDDVEAAQQAVTALLGVMPDFTPGLDEPPRFVRMVGQMKREVARSTTSSVSKMNESLLEAPATVIVVTADQIRRRGYLDLEAVIHDLPGFDTSRSNGYSYSNLYQRGYRSDTTNRTLFLVDGVEQNDLHSNTAHISRQFPLTNIDRVEVVYGPASTMYGANAFLGVINVMTKDPDDVIAEGKQIGADVQVGGGAWNTRFIDATIAGRYRGATLSLTGRLYKSDEWDLSKYDNWNYDPAVFASPASKAQYDRFLFGTGFGEVAKKAFFDYRFVDPYNPITLDGRASASKVNGRPVGYSELTDDWMLSGKLKVKNFTVGLQAWQRREGATGEGTDMEVPGALNGNVWIPRETSFFVRYSEPLSGRLNFSYLGQAKIHSVANGSSVFSMNGYLNGPFDSFDLYGNNFYYDDGVGSYWSQTLVAESSTQIRNELNLVYRPANAVNILGGVDLRNGSIQADYVKGTDCDPFALLSNIQDSQLKEVVNIYRNNDFIIDRMYQVLAPSDAQPTGGVWIRCFPTLQSATLPVAGGEHFAVRDIGAFTQASYKPTRNSKLVAGFRVDNNHVSQGSGFGTVFTPRLGIIYSPGGFVTKAIYSEAFKDPSNFEKFTTLPGILDHADPEQGLRPERARNVEISLGRQWSHFSADFAAYQTRYSNLVSLAPHSLVSDPEVKAFVEGVTSRIGPVKGLTFSDYTAYSQKISDDLPTAVNHLGPALIRKIFDDPIFIQRFENAGALRVSGVQANASYSYRTTDIFGNYTYTNPILTVKTEVRERDIASHHVNLGIQHRWRRLDISARMNYVGARPTVSIASPLDEIPSYAVTHVAVSYDFLPGFTAQLLLNNIFNASYADPGVRTADNIRFAARIPQPGRSIFVKLLTRQIF